MSVVGEIALAAGLVAGCAAIISAYRDGGSIVEKVKRKRAERRRRPVPTELEESMSQTPTDIQRETDRGIAKFGDSFKNGDTTVILIVQQITIKVQASLLEKLRNAYEEETDFTALINDAYMRRNETITALLEFQQRLLQAATITRLPNPRLGLAGETQVSMARILSPDTMYTQALPIKTQANDQYRGAGESERQRRFDFFHAFKRHSNDRVSAHDEPSDHNASHVQRIYTLPQSANTTSHASTSMSRSGTQESYLTSSTGLTNSPVQSSDYVYEEWEDNLAEIWGSRSQRSSSCADSVVDFRPTGPTRSFSTQSSSGNIQHPGPSNEYLGFCKGAWKLQCGDRLAMVESRDYSQSAQARATFLRCSECRFEGHINPRMIWNKILVFEKLGMKIRFAFLAKSHIKQRNQQDRKSATQLMFTYQCMFCVFLRIQSPAMTGPLPYLEHIRDCHHGTAMSDVVLDRTSCISGRLCDDHEEFDINLFPISNDQITELP